ncbi:hypothetical protein IMSAGC011_02496 [Lachnospiraceae bacterium]|nr:hypothetical protein IMSAGC011_02496 [Lachnospiraceae bacterium]
MIIEIEYFKGDVLLTGKPIPYKTFLRQLREIEICYDRMQDNFISLLCRRFGWSIIDSKVDIKPTYRYDRDIKKAFYLSRFDSSNS